MRIVVTQNVTLDGVLEAHGGWFEPSEGSDGDDLVAALRQQMDEEAGLLLGRDTFESFREYWPAQASTDTTGISAHLDAVPKYVLSSSLSGDPGWANTTVLRSLDDVRSVPGDGVLGVTGSISVVHQLVAAGLVDEWRLFVYPVVLGSGRRLLPDGERADLSLVSSRPLRSGVVLQTYRPAPRSG